MAVFALPAVILPLYRLRPLIHYPSVNGEIETTFKDHLNQTILNLVEANIKKQMAHQASGSILRMQGEFEVKTNERGILSMMLSNHALFSNDISSRHEYASLTCDIYFKEYYTLASLFRPEADYIDVLSKQVAIQLKQRKPPVLRGFQSIRRNHGFYLAEKTLVLYFERAETSPDYAGVTPMFPIPIYDLLDIAAAPLLRLAGDFS